jgi:nitrogen regulatory protein PII
MDNELEHTPASTSTGEGFVLVTIIIKPFRLEAVLNAIKPFHVVSLTASEVRGYGRQKGHLELYRGSEYTISFIPKVKLELVAPMAEIEELIAAASLSARTGRIGDGKVFIQGVTGLHTEAPLPLA